MNYYARIVKPEDIDDAWHLVSDLIDEAVDYSNEELSNDIIKNKCKSGVMLLVVICKDDEVVACFTYEMRQFDTNKKALFIVTISGHEMPEWIQDMNDLSNKFAIMLECEEIYAIGRKGWGKFIKNMGYNEIHTVYSKEVH